ncbi:MAG: tetratricopeptide repeat protein [Elusimicrobia bacterium]|nr:tetratricopeptide repeat protein [Elusimicrobiota bacterium]
MSDRALLRLLVLAATFAAFAPCLSAGFVSWDDQAFILDNPMIRGFDAAHLRAMAGPFIGGVWIPLTWLSLALDRFVWGVEPAGYHLTSLLLHAASALLFYEIGLLLFEPKLKKSAAAAAALAALFFALHPLRVESVAWLAERKGVLSGALWLAALYAELRGRRAAALAAFAFSLAAKPNGVTLPLVLLVLDAFWFRMRPSAKKYLPYFALSAAAVAATVAAGKTVNANATLHAPGAAWGVGQALYGLLFYPWKTLLPSGLAPCYPPKPWFGYWSWQLAACAAAVAAAAAALYAARDRYRPAVVAVACYALAVLPMLGLVQHGLLFSAADRFSYLPCLGFAVLFGAVFGAGGAQRRLIAALWLFILGSMTWRQCVVWHDSLSLWSATVTRAPSALAEGELGMALIAAGRDEDGAQLLTRVVASGDAQPNAYINLGVALHRLGRDEDARETWREGLTGKNFSPESAAMLGASLAKKSGNTDPEGAAYLMGALTERPDRADWEADLGDALALGGKTAEARKEYEAALALNPAFGRAHNNLGLLLERAGQGDEALAHYRLALADPESRAQANHNLGNRSLAAGRNAEAERRFREAIRVDPGLVASRVNLGNLLARRGRLADAAEQYRAALKKDRASREARANLDAVERVLRR